VIAILAAMAQLARTPTLALAQPAPATAAPATAATTAPAVPASGDETAAPTEEAKSEARLHFTKGLTLSQEGAWAAALAEFTISRGLFPTRAATQNAALSLRELHRFDEALDMYETLLRDFATIPPGDRTAAQRAIAELRELVGTIEVTAAEPGAAITISGQDRGEYPQVKPLRVSAGSHVVRLFKEGFEPFETRVEIAGGQTAKVAAKLRVLRDSGRLKVTDRSGMKLDVMVDNVIVGKTPWEGILAVGAHSVQLKGEGKLGTQPASAPVRSQQVTALTLVAEDLESSLRVEPTPINATVAIDSVTVGRGLWLGRLRKGMHRVEITSEGFLPVTKQVNLERGAREILKTELERDPNALIWRKPSRFVFEADVGFALTPSLGGDVAGTCSGTCSRGLGLGALGLFHGGYELGSGFGFGLTAGYVISVEGVEQRPTTLIPISGNMSPPPQVGTANDALRLSAFVGGATASYHLGDRFPVLVRAGVGVLVGQMRDERSGTFKTQAGMSYNAYPIVSFAQAAYLYLDPELRAGLRIGDHMELTAGLQAFMLFALSQPRWNDKLELAAASDGIGRYAGTPTMGEFVLLLSPSVGVRYDF
jgi:PEGA domain